MVSPQSHSSAPVRVPSPQRGPHSERLVVKPDSVSWKFDSLGWRSAWNTAISYVLPIVMLRFTLVRARQSAGLVVATIVIGSTPGQAVMTPVALSEPPSIVDAMPAALTCTRPGNRWWTPPRSSARTPLMKMNRSSSP